MKKKIDSSVATKVTKSIIFAVLIIYSLSMILLLVWGFLTSLKNDLDYSLLKNKFGFPNATISGEELKFLNYRLIFENFSFKRNASYYAGQTLVVKKASVNFFDMILNSIIYAGMGSFLHAILTCTMGYVTSKYRFKMSSIIYATCLFTMIVPTVGTNSSTVAMLRAAGLYDSWAGYIMQSFNFIGMHYLVFFAYFKGLPDSYVEAAEIDGASQTMILFKIIFPLAAKTISTIMLLHFVSLWNNYQTPLLYLPTHPTLAYGIYYMVYQNPVGFLSKLPIKIASCMILAIPLLIAFIFLKDKLMGNVSLGGLKE